MTDLFAHEYGWSKKEILEQVYPDEVEQYQKQIIRRRANEYRLALMMIQSPHTKKPKEAWSILESMERSIDDSYLDEELDREGFKLLKAKLSRSGRVIVK